MATHFRGYRYRPTTIYKQPTEEERLHKEAISLQRESDQKKGVIHDAIVPLSKESKKDVWKYVAKGPREFIDRLDPISELQNTNHILIKKAGNEFKHYFINMNCAWELLNSKGRKIFFACETLFDWSIPDVDNESCTKKEPTFDISIVGTNGGGALNITAHHSKTSVSGELEYIGEIRCTSFFNCVWCGLDSYIAENSRGKKSYKIKYHKKSNTVGLPPNFRIIDKEKNDTVVGKITNEWEVGELPKDQLWNTYYGINFCDAVPLKSRMLLLGAFFTIIGTEGFYSVNQVLDQDFEIAEEIEAESRATASLRSVKSPIVKVANKKKIQQVKALNKWKTKLPSAKPGVGTTSSKPRVSAGAAGLKDPKKTVSKPN